MSNTARNVTVLLSIYRGYVVRDIVRFKDVKQTSFEIYCSIDHKDKLKSEIRRKTQYVEAASVVSIR